MTDRALDWDNLRYFLAVARAGKLTVAARRLGQDHTTVGRRISALESGFGSKLFERRPEGYRLTEAGKKLFQNVEVMESSVSGIQRDLAGCTKHVEGSVRIGTPDEFGTLFLAKYVGDLYRIHPKLRIELIVLPYALSVSKREVDIVIGAERPTEGRLFVRKLADYELRLYATREYLTAHSPIETPDDLSQHTWIGSVTEFGPTSMLDFPPEIATGLTPHIKCSSFLSQLTATLSGAGVSMLPRFIADREKSLVPILADSVSATRAYHMVVHADLRDMPRVRAVSNFIAQRVAEARMLFMPSNMNHTRAIRPPPFAARELPESLEALGV
jgi:DNA-binding transcriptional LysR family regulator